MITRALAKEKEDRHPTCGALVAEAREALDVEPSAGDLARTAAADTFVPRARTRAEREPETLRLERRAPRRVRLFAAGALLLAAGAVALAFVVASGDDEGPSADRATARPARPAPALPSRTVKVGNRPFGLGVGEGGVWVANTDDDQVRRLDPRSGRPLGEPIGTGDGPVWLTVTAGRVWVANQRADTVTRIDPATGSVLNPAFRWVTARPRSQPAKAWSGWRTRTRTRSARFRSRTPRLRG